MSKVLTLGQVPPVSALPPNVQRYARSGQPMSVWPRDTSGALNQVLPCVWGVLGLGAAWMARRSYMKDKARRRPSAAETRYWSDWESPHDEEY